MPGTSQEVQRLKAENEQLRQQLESLRRQNQELRATLAKASAELAEAAGGTNRPSRAPANAQNKAQPRVPGAGGHGYWLSSSGKRHNSNCRLYGTSRGRPCGASDGAACKLCGG
jgi:cell division septum initiation protein DivIVA